MYYTYYQKASFSLFIYKGLAETLILFIISLNGNTIAIVTLHHRKDQRQLSHNIMFKRYMYLKYID